jgi:hypothetical protein
MPLRDHFHSSSTYLKWEALHGGWPMMIVRRLNSSLPEQYIAQPRGRLGDMMAIDIAALERDSDGGSFSRVDDEESLICVTIVDVVTSRTANLYGDLLDEPGAQRTPVSRSAIYAATCRGRRFGPRWRLEAWEHELAVGLSLPTLPLWLSADFNGPVGPGGDLRGNLRVLADSLIELIPFSASRRQRQQGLFTGRRAEWAGR